MRGRKPKPTALKIFQGNPGKRKLPTDEPKPNDLRSIPEPPEWLDEPGKEFWKDYAPRLAAVGLLKDVDLAAFAAAATAYSDFVVCSKYLTGERLVIKTTNGNFVPNPMVSIRNKADERLNRWLSQFGMSPTSRVARGDKKAPVDPIEAGLAEQMGQTRTG